MAIRITLDPVTRIEGHAKITLDCNDNGDINHGHLHVLELRGFEKLVEGMELSKMPLITGRICGVCPAAHHLASVRAIENGCDITVPPTAQLLRELLYMGHILHSHALSCFVLIGPDLLRPDLIDEKDGKTGNRNIFRLLVNSPDLAKKALRLRSIGQKIVEKIGGRGIHPVTAIPGGISIRPSSEDVATIQGWGEEALTLLKEFYPFMIEKLEELTPVREQTFMDMYAVALSKNGVVAFLEGTAQIIDTTGSAKETFTADDYDRILQEHLMEGSYMKSVRLIEGGSYFVGPLARLMVNHSSGAPEADQLLTAFREQTGKRFAAMDAIRARLIEMVCCAEKIIDYCKSISADGPLSTPCRIVEGRYRSIIEAPRGILIHDYSADAEGKVTAANLIVATQNNYDAIDSTITALARNAKPSGDEQKLFDAMEFAVRCFDPCLSCATHFTGRMPLRIELRKNGTPFQTLTRGE